MCVAAISRVGVKPRTCLETEGLTISFVLNGNHGVMNEVGDVDDILSLVFPMPL